MKESLRSLVAGTAGALVVAAVVVGQPALAGQLDKAAAKNSVTSKSIKNGTIKTKDLNADVNASLAKANSALQSLADNSVTNPKLADDAVGSAEVAPNSLTAQDLADNSVSGNEINGNAVASGEVSNHSLVADDIAAQNGVETINFGNIPASTCDDAVILTSNTSLAGDVILVTPGNTFNPNLIIQAQPQAALGGNILMTVCNWTGSAIDPASTDFGYMVFEN